MKNNFLSLDESTCIFPLTSVTQATVVYTNICWLLSFHIAYGPPILGFGDVNNFSSCNQWLYYTLMYVHYSVYNLNRTGAISRIYIIFQIHVDILY